jgi:hypothetical protein
VAAAAGLGKSHLLQAACHSGAARGARVAYLPLDDLSELRPEALDGLEQLDLVALDALETVLGQPAWEQALFALINAARDAGTRLIFAARRPPAELSLDLPDLRSRLGWGPVLALEALSDEQKSAALEQRAAALGVAVRPLEWSIYIAASLLTAMAVTTAGSIGFVGLVVPHMLRLVLGNDQRLILPACALAGGTLLVLADTLARTLIAPEQLPVGVITALLGVPTFLFLLYRSR